MQQMIFIADFIACSTCFGHNGAPKHVEHAIKSAINIICCISLALYFHIITTMHGQNHFKLTHLCILYVIKHFGMANTKFKNFLNVFCIFVSSVLKSYIHVSV